MNAPQSRFKVGVNTWLALGIVVVLVAMTVISFRLYTIAFRETKISQGRQQLQIARATANSVQHYLQHLSDDLHLLASFPGLQYFEPEPLKSNMDYFHLHSVREAVESIFVVNLQGEIIHATGNDLPQWALASSKEKLAIAKTDSAMRQVWLSQVRRDSLNQNVEKLHFLVAVPLIQYFRDSIHPNPSNALVGLVGYIVDFDWLVEKYIAHVRVGQTGFAWILDHSGRLLYHPKHPEMLLRSIFSTSPECGDCHASFDKQKEILRTPSSFSEYHVAKEPAKILAQAPVNLGGEQWHIAVAIDLAEVSAAMRKNFALFFWLVGLVIVCILAGGIFLLFVNIRRVRAEAAARLSEEKRLLQGQIDQAARLASIGELVDSVAHEINTPLGVIHAHLGALKMNHEKLPYDDVVETVLDQTRRIGDYTKRLLRLSRRLPFHPAPTQLSEMIEDCLQLLGPAIRKNAITVRSKWPKKMPAAEIDRDQMQQVMINLLKNAIDALEGPGEIRVTIRRSTSGASGKGFVIRIADTGLGISADHLDRIFDPFFSTKPPNKGTGLGLPISRAIVERHGGKIEVKSEPGKGARFEIFLPIKIKKGTDKNGDDFIGR